MRKTHSLSEVENSWVCVHSHQEDSRCPAASPLVLWHQKGCHLFWPQVPALSLCSVLSLKLPLRPLCPRKRLRLSRGPCLAPLSPSSGRRGQRDAAGWSSSPGLEWSCSRPVSWGHRKPLPLLFSRGGPPCGLGSRSPWRQAPEAGPQASRGRASALRDGDSSETESAVPGPGAGPSPSGPRDAGSRAGLARGRIPALQPAGSECCGCLTPLTL